MVGGYLTCSANTSCMIKATLTLADEGQEWLSFHRPNIWSACRGVLLMAIDLGCPGFTWGHLVVMVTRVLSYLCLTSLM